MEEQAAKLVAQVGLIAIAIYVVFAALGKGSQVRVKGHASTQIQDPNSVVWSNTRVQGPNASVNRGIQVSGYVGVA